MASQMLCRMRTVAFQSVRTTGTRHNSSGAPRGGAGRVCPARGSCEAVPQRDVRVRFFKFGKNGMGADEAGVYASQGRDDYEKDDVEFYFNYMGMLAVEGSYDKMDAMLATNMHPADIILLWACQENDTPKVQELLSSGADITVKNVDGKTPMDLATKPEILAMLEEYAAKRKAAA